jgi:hypothetical protein
VLYEVRLGPFATLTEAELVGRAVRRSHGLTPSVLVEEGPTPDAEDDQ